MASIPETSLTQSPDWTNVYLWKTNGEVCAILDPETETLMSVAETARKYELDPDHLGKRILRTSGQQLPQISAVLLAPELPRGRVILNPQYNHSKDQTLSGWLSKVVPGQAIFSKEATGAVILPKTLAPRARLAPSTLAKWARQFTLETPWAEVRGQYDLLLR